MRKNADNICYDYKGMGKLGDVLRIILFVLGVVFVICMLPAVRAQSLSDLDMSTFERQTEQQEIQTHTNPFASGVSTAEDLAIEDLQLTGIVYRDTNEAYALISGYLVRAGDRIAGYRVDNIEGDKVKLRRLNEVMVLALGGGI